MNDQVLPQANVRPTTTGTNFRCSGERTLHRSFGRVLGAANANLFKFGLTVMVTYLLGVGWLTRALAELLIGPLFILPAQPAAS